MERKVAVDFDQHGQEYRNNFAELTRRTREACPVAFSERYGGYYVITEIDVASEVLRDHNRFSAFKDITGVGNGFEGVQIPNPNPGVSAGFLEMDPPLQLDFRHVLNPYLSPLAVNRWRPLVADMAKACINDRIDSGRIDFVDDLANVVPAIVTMAMLGLPLSDWTSYCEPAHATFYTPPDSPDLPRVQMQTMEMVMKLISEIGRIRREPHPGIIDSLITAEINGEHLDDLALVGTVFLVIGGGFDTTTALTANSLNWLDQNPEHRPLLATEGKELDLATEEFLRYFAPSAGDARTTTIDTEIAGVPLTAGDRVLCSFAMVNRDPKVFDEPDELRIDRFPNRHAAFGLGNHRCIGSNLARMQFKGMLTEVLRRIPDYRIDTSGVNRYETVGIINGYQHLPATFAPRERDGESLADAIERWQDLLDKGEQ